MRVIRILIYEGDPKYIEKQLGHSMNDGTRSGIGNVQITAITLGELPVALRPEWQTRQSEDEVRYDAKPGEEP